jgi:hypothetical protein
VAIARDQYGGAEFDAVRRFVFSAMRSRVIHMSWAKAGTSGHQTARKPRSSARSAYSTVRGPGGRRKSWVSTARSRISAFEESITICGVVEPLRVERASVVGLLPAFVSSVVDTPYGELWNLARALDFDTAKAVHQIAGAKVAIQARLAPEPAMTMGMPVVRHS